MTRRRVLAIKSNFGSAHRALRIAVGVRQEQFDGISNRTYVSALERGLKQPTLPKIDELASVLGVHPLSLLVLCYLDQPTTLSVRSGLDAVQREIDELLALGLGASSR